MLFFLALSILGCVLCIALHVLSYAGIGNGSAQAAATLLFFGAFITMIAASAVHLAGPRGGDGKPFTLDALQKSAPRWMRWLVGAIVIYCVANFLSFIVMENGEPTVEPSGQLSLHSKGKFVRTLTPREFRWHQGLQARGMSGHPLAFYTISAMLFFSAWRQRQRDTVVAPARGPAAVTVTNSSPASPLLDYARSSPPLPIWVHMMLYILSMMLGWLGMPALLVIGLGRFVPGPAGAILFIGGAFGGVFLVNFLFKKAIPARCPNCLGRAYCKHMSSPTQYVCRDCGYVHKSV